MKQDKIKRIEVKNLSKSFKANCKKQSSILSSIIDFITFKKEKKNIVIVDNVSFDVYSGEIIGIIGKNGAGKSSLLRLIAGIYRQDSGSVKNHGKVVYLSGFGYGLVPKLTMKENIMIMGAILGLSQKDLKNKFSEIIDFSGLREYVDMKVYQFSTGMLARLNFSVMIHCVSHHNPDILLIDEVFSAGGDVDFEYKAIKKMEELIKGGAAVILVSHDMEALKKYCDEIIWIDGGFLKMKGNSSYVIDDYIKSFYI